MLPLNEGKSTIGSQKEQQDIVKSVIEQRVTYKRSGVAKSSNQQGMVQIDITRKKAGSRFFENLSLPKL